MGEHMELVKMNNCDVLIGDKVRIQGTLTIKQAASNAASTVEASKRGAVEIGEVLFVQMLLFMQVLK